MIKKELEEEIEKIKKEFTERQKDIMERFNKEMLGIRMPSALGSQAYMLPNRIREMGEVFTKSVLDALNSANNDLSDKIVELKNNGMLTPEMEEVLMRVIEEMGRK